MIPKKEKLLFNDFFKSHVKIVANLSNPELFFRDDGVADISLFGALCKAGRFDFLIGVLPNSSQAGCLLITGVLYTVYQNPFGRFNLYKCARSDMPLRFSVPRAHVWLF